VLLAPIGIGALRPSIKRVCLPLLSLAAWLGPLVIRRWAVHLVVSAATGRLKRPTRRAIDEYWAPSQWRKYGVAVHALLRDFDWGALGGATIASLPIPLVAVLGERDPLIQVADLAGLRRDIAPKRIVVIPGAGHIVADEAVAAVNAELVALLALVTRGD
jgi:pimeloyl-ACP methyl ester carboxylesterase